MAQSTHISQLPRGDQLFLDHVGHFVGDPARAKAALVSAGFAVTPFSVQTAPDPAGGPPQPTGTGNLCAMLRAGYIEVLGKVAETPLAAEFDFALRGHAGLHLAAFAVADAGAMHARLAAAEFPMRPLVYFERKVETPEGDGLAAFRVVRFERGVMPEGRMQALTHLTEETVWQPRWLDHPNGAQELLACIFRVDDLAEAIRRFERFLERKARLLSGGACLTLDRGMVVLAAPDRLRTFGPAAGAGGIGYALRVASLDRLMSIFARNGIRFCSQGRCLTALFPEGLGSGVWQFMERAEDFDPQEALDLRL